MNKETIELEVDRFSVSIMKEMERGSQILNVLEKEARPLLRRLFSLPSADHIEYATIGPAFYTEKNVLVEVKLWLDPAHKDSPLVREIVREGIASTVRKQESYQQDSLVGTFTQGQVRVHILGWLPQTCRVEEEVEVRPVEEKDYLVGEDGRVYHRRVVRKVVCGED